jgi:hypothetical protein
MRRVAWCVVAALVVLTARVLAYALVPGQTTISLELGHSLGGPRLLVVASAALGVATAVSVAAVWLAAVAVRERLALERAIVVAPPRIRMLRLAGRFVALFAATSLAFALLESYLHWRAGLGWHGLHCLVGPVHRDALPLLAALSLVAAALAEAAQHLVAWARRTLARLAPHVRPSPHVSHEWTRAAQHLVAVRVAGALPARGPPHGRISALEI